MHLFKNFYEALTQGERKAFSLGALGAVIGILGLGLAWYFSHTVAIPKQSGSYREGIVGQPAYINPVVARSAADRSLTTLLFANTTDLSDHIEAAENGTVVKVHLKDGLTWSDGQPVTSDDVIFTVNAIQNPDSNSPLFSAWQGVTLSRISQLEVDFRLPGAYAFFNDNLADLRPIPKHLFASIPPANWKLSEYNSRPVASGPYTFVSRSVGSDGFISSYRLRANPEFSGQHPYISTLELAFFHNRNDLVQSFNRGSVEGFFTTDTDALRSVNRPHQTVHFSAPTYYAVFWNQTANTALAQAEVRQALAAAINVPELTKKELGGYGAPATDPFSTILSPLSDNSTSTETNGTSTAADPIAKARDILEKHGWALGDDGVYAKHIAKSKTRLEFSLSVPDVPFLVDTANSLKDSWQKAGANLTVTVMPLEDLLAGPIKNRTYEAILFGNTLTREGDAFSFWHSSERLYPGLNLSLYQNTAADRLIEKIRTETDPAKRNEDMDTLRRTITKDDPALFLFSPTATYVATKGLRGVTPALATDASDRFREVSSWYVATKRVWK